MNGSSVWKTLASQVPGMVVLTVLTIVFLRHLETSNARWHAAVQEVTAALQQNTAALGALEQEVRQLGR